MHLISTVKSFIENVEKSGGKPLYKLTPKQARQVLTDVQQFSAAAPETDVTEIYVADGDTAVPVKIHRPKGVVKRLPVVFYIHGGGWVMGDDKTHERLVRELAAGIPAAVVFPVYTPSPESEFPRPTDQLFAVLNHIVARSADLGLDAGRLAVAGDSVGGNMAIAMTMKAKDAGAPKIAFQLLIYPVTDAAMTSESYTLYENGPWLTRKAMEWFWKMYAPDENDRLSPPASPLNWPAEAMKGLPPALVITDENDVLRDEGEAYARKLDEAGVRITSVRFNGTIHDFMMLNPVSESPATRDAVLLTVAKLRDVFGIC